jgi:MFS family permease
MFAMLGFLFFVSLYLQAVLGYSAVQAGATYLPTTLLMMVAAPIAGKLSDGVGARWPIAAGMTLFGGALVILSRLDASSTFWEMLPGLAVGGIGIGLVTAPTTTTAIGSLPVDKAGVASGVVNTFRQTGGSLGIAIMGAILVSNLGDTRPGSPGFVQGFIPGFHDALRLTALVCFAGAVFTAITIRKPTPTVAPEIVPAAEAEAGPVPAPSASVPEAYPCPVCLGDGWFTSAPPQDPRTQTCPRCYGQGYVLTGSHVPAHIVRECPECHAIGYVEARVEAGAAADGPKAVSRATERPASRADWDVVPD